MASVFMKFRPFYGPNRFIFVDPDTKYEYTASSQAELVKKIIGYRTQNRLEPIEALDAVLENYWCYLPENKGKCKPYKLSRGFLQTLKGGISLLVNYAYDKFVSQKKADERSEICRKCPYNIHPEKGSIGTWLDEIAIASVGDRKSSAHDDLGTCAICSCPLACKVWYGGTLDLSEDELDAMPDYCWQKKEVLNG